MDETVTVDDYLNLRRRFDVVVELLTNRGRKEEADYHMIYFFLFFEEFERLRAYITDSERMLADGEW